MLRTGRWMVFAVLVCGLSRAAFAAGEILIDSISLEEKSVHRYVLTGVLTNATAEPYEVTYRAQITFYDKTAPKGDVPAMLLRQDKTVVLRAGERRSVETLFLNEGEAPRGDVRLEPMLRIRRQRPWSY